MTPSLDLDNVTLDLGGNRFRYDFSLEGPSLVAVTGPSGAGKSTLFHLIAGFETPDGGRISINGQDVGALPPGKRPLTSVFQEHNLFAHLDVFANVALGISPALRLDADERALVTDALADVGLGGFERRMTNELSGGERQRVAFARALVRRRPLLLLDEPFASLDPDLRAGMGTLLTGLRRRHDMLVLMISHDRDEVRRLADRVIEIRAGTNVFIGSPQDWASAESPSK